MATTTVSSRQFNQDASGAKRAAQKGPVFITDRGEPRHVLLSIEDYRRLTRAQRNIVDALAMAGDDAVAFEAPRATVGIKPVDLG